MAIISRWFDLVFIEVDFNRLFQMYSNRIHSLELQSNQSVIWIYEISLLIFKFVNFSSAVVEFRRNKRLKLNSRMCFDLVANSASDIQYGWRLGNNKSVNFDTKVLLSQFDLIGYSQFDDIVEMNGRMFIPHTKKKT